LISLPNASLYRGAVELFGLEFVVLMPVGRSELFDSLFVEVQPFKSREAALADLYIGMNQVETMDWLACIDRGIKILSVKIYSLTPL
jgi:hypothetical protein